MLLSNEVLGFPLVSLLPLGSGDAFCADCSFKFVLPLDTKADEDEAQTCIAAWPANVCFDTAKFQTALNCKHD